MLFQLKAKRKGWMLTITTCPGLGLRPQVDLSKTRIKTFGGLEKIKQELNRQALERNRPLALVDFEGTFISKSDNWPKENRNGI